MTVPWSGPEWWGICAVSGTPCLIRQADNGQTRSTGEGWGGFASVLHAESRALAAGVIRGAVPVGILLDRLTEYPEECEAPPELVAEAVAELRRRNPLGTETNW